MAVPLHSDLGDEWGCSPQGRGLPSEPLRKVSHGDWIRSAVGITSSWTPSQPTLFLSRLSLAAKAMATATCCAPDASSAPRGEGSGRRRVSGGRGGGSGGRVGSQWCSILDQNAQKMLIVEESNILWRATSPGLVLPEESCVVSPISHVLSDPLSMEDQSWVVMRGPHLHKVARLCGEGGRVASIGLTHPCTAPRQHPD